MADILEELDIENCVLIGHSVGVTIACLASMICLSRIAMIAPSPYFMIDGAYTGGFDRKRRCGD